MSNENQSGGRRATDHDQKQSDDIQLILDKLSKLEDTLKPIAETYQTVTRLGKWAMAGLVLVSVIIGILLGIKNLLTHKL